MRRIGVQTPLLVALTWATTAGAQDKSRLTLNDLSLDVAALQTLYQLQVTKTQMKALRELAAKTASNDVRQPAKGSDAFRMALIDLRLALIEANDDDRIGEVFERAEELRATENPTLDDAIDVTEEALEAAPRVFRMLSAKQIAAYAGLLADDLLDPLELILEALPKVRKLNDEQWRAFRNEAAEQIGTLLGGVDSDKAGRYRDKVTQLLIVVRSLRDEEFDKQKPQLESKARTLVGDVGALDVIRNQIEYQLAELLSNSRLAAALDARLK